MIFSKSNITILVLVALVIAGGVYFRDDVVKIYDSFGRKLEQIRESDLGNVIGEIGKEILNPPPLNIGGSANNAVLTKAEIISQTNLQRNENGKLPALVENAKLNAAALAKANDMFKQQYFEHVSPAGVDPATLVKEYGYDYVVTGENLILGNFKNEQEVVQLWMDSPGHRENILNKRFTEIGVAVVKGTYKGKIAWIGVQEFGLPLSACPQASVTLRAKIELNKDVLDALSLKIENKRQEIERMDKRSSKYNTAVDEYNEMVAEFNALNEETKNIIAQYNQQVDSFNQCVAGTK